MLVIKTPNEIIIWLHLLFIQVQHMNRNANKIVNAKRLSPIQKNFFIVSVDKDWAIITTDNVRNDKKNIINIIRHTIFAQHFV